MRTFQRKRLNKIKIVIERHNKLFFIITVCIILFGVFLVPRVFHLFIQVHSSFENKNLAEKKQAELENRKLNLTKDISRLNSEFGLEAEIREKFPVVKEGEEMVVFIDRDTQPTNTIVKKSFWRNLLDFFK